MRNCAPDRRTLPYSRLSTLRLRPADFGSSVVAADEGAVPEFFPMLVPVGGETDAGNNRPTITCRPCSLASSAVSSWVRPGAMYCISGSAELSKSAKGKTDTECGEAEKNLDPFTDGATIDGANLDCANSRAREPSGEVAIRAAAKATTASAPAR